MPVPPETPKSLDIDLVRDRFLDLYMPYCVRKVPDKHGGWAVLNREYRLLGQHSQHTVNGVDFDWRVCPLNLRIPYIPGLLMRQLSFNKVNSNPESVWLYDGSTNPLNSEKNAAAYFQRVKHLLALNTGMYSCRDQDSTYCNFGDWLVNTAFDSEIVCDLKRDFIDDCRSSGLVPVEIVRPTDLYIRMKAQGCCNEATDALREASSLWGADWDELAANFL